MLLPRPILLAVLAVATASSGAAQEQPVSRELVHALLMGAPEIAVGRAPTGFPAELVPGGGRVLGGFRRDTASAVVAVAVPQAPDAAREAAQQALLGAGWTNARTVEARGFVARETSSWGFLCRGTETVSISSSPAPRGGSYLRMDYYRNRADVPSACSPPPAGYGTDLTRAAPVPALKAPAGAEIVSSGWGSRGMSSESRIEANARVRSTLAPAELVAAFGTQLQQAGWAGSPASGGGEVATQAFRIRAADGKEWFGVLMAVAYPGSELRDVEFGVSTLPPPAR